jgi:hypothetical protein
MREGIPMTTSYHLRPLCTILLSAVTLGVGAVTQVTAGTNPDFRIVLHAKPSSFETCNGYLPLDCIGNPPTVNVPATPIAVFVLLFNYTAASGIQTAFTFGGWNPTFFLWDCGLIGCDFAPCDPPPFPPVVVVAGDFIGGCLNGPALRVLGRMFFVPGSGCISQVIPAQPNGIHLRDCTGGVDLITDPSSPRLGKICLNTGGVNACDGVVPVEATTWGQIKSTY